jgi:hypothetical protein
MSSITVREGKKHLVFTESYNDGINEMTFSGHKFRVQDNGKTLNFGSQKFDLNIGKETIIVGKNGAAYLIQ